MRQLAVNEPAGGDERDYQRSAEEKSQQVIRDACRFHVFVGQAFLPVHLLRDSSHNYGQAGMPVLLTSSSLERR